MGQLCSARFWEVTTLHKPGQPETMKIPWISDIYVKTCWSPCFWHPTVRSGSYAIAVYTIAMSIIIITYLIDLLNGGDASQFYLPLFETNLHSDAQHAGRFCIIMLMLLILAAVLLIWGITKDVRGLMIPRFGLRLIFGYYIYLDGVFAAQVDFAWMSYNIYCWFVVRNHYRNVKWFQSPDIEVLQEYAK